jgi:hypothetical protein
VQVLRTRPLGLFVGTVGSRNILMIAPSAKANNTNHPHQHKLPTAISQDAQALQTFQLQPCARDTSVASNVPRCGRHTSVRTMDAMSWATNKSTRVHDNFLSLTLHTLVMVQWKCFSSCHQGPSHYSPWLENRRRFHCRDPPFQLQRGLPTLFSLELRTDVHGE